MNPYLEGHWQDVHARMTIYIADQLQEKLPLGLVARAEQQVAIGEEDQQGALRPDVQISEPPALHEPAGAMPNLPPGPISGGVAEPLVVLLDPETHRWVEIRSAEGRLVSVVEVLSPSNKSDAGQAAYHRRQRAYLRGKVNLIEIDLLRKGEWVLSVPLSELPESARAPYMVCVYRAGFPDQREVYSLRLRERLPVIRVPLRSSDADVALDLQILVDQVFERGRYWMLDYRPPPVPPLSAEEEAWADGLLRQSGLRP